MPDEERERFEDYLVLEHIIEDIRTGSMAHPPENMTPEQARLYQMAALFHAATSENAQPRQEFAEQLKARLLGQDNQQAIDTSSTPPSSVDINDEVEPATPNAPVLPSDQPHAQSRVKPARFFSRRGLISGGAAAAASLFVGVALEHTIEQGQNQKPGTDNGTRSTAPASTSSSPTPTTNDTQLVSSTMPTEWLLVTSLAELGQGVVRFTSDTIIGYVLRISGTDTVTGTTGKDQLIALSAACTHMGCLVQWEQSDRHFHCPCHEAMFAQDGSNATLHYHLSLPPLPRLETKIEDGNVYVQIPQKPK